MIPKPIVRKIQVDFSQARIDWIPADPELAQFWNAISLGLPLLEGFLIRALGRAKRELPPDRPDLIEDCQLFCEQEGYHTQAHLGFNDMVRKTGYYPRLEEYIDKLREDYVRYGRERDLRFALLYAEGFETAGPILASYFLERANARFQDDNVDLGTVSLWRWHLCEEFAHRCCAFNAVEALYGTYWGRVGGILFATRHLLNFALSLSSYLIAEDIKAGR